MNLLTLRRSIIPSLGLGYYMGKTYILRFLAMLLGLVATLQLLDLMAHTDKIMSAEGATSAGLFYYVSLRAPQLISQFIPFSALLATLLTLASLSQHSEIIIMKAAGLSAQKILFPLALPCLFIALLHFAFDNFITTKTSAELRYWEDNDYAVNLPPASEYSTEARFVEGNALILIKAVSKNGNVVILDKVSIYERGESGNLEKLIRANFAVHAAGAWQLFEVRSFDPLTHQMTTSETQDWDVTIPPERFLAATINPDLVNFKELYTAISDLKAEGGNVQTLEASLYQKIAGPMASLLMPLLGAIAGFGIHRAGTLLTRAVLGMALGFTFFVADNFMLAMGEFGVAPPLMAAGAPFLLFMSVGLAVIFFTEE